MIMTLDRLTLRAFKGIREQTLIFGGSDALIAGANGTGKTTVVDAWLWLLCGKDSSGRKDFTIKTLTADGQSIPHLDHEVEAILTCDGTPLALKKVYSEKWTKKRGQATAQFTGHTTDHFIDGVPVTEKAYAARIADLVDEDIFRLVTVPTFFNEGLRWQDRRELLLRICGAIPDADVLAQDAALAALPGLMQGRSLEDHRKVVMARRAEINRELERIPIRIDEATRALPPETVVDPGELQAAREAVDQAAAARQAIVVGGAVATAQLRLTEAVAAVQAAENAYAQQVTESQRTARNARLPLEDRVGDLRRRHTQVLERMESLERTLQALSGDLAAKRDEWRQEASQRFIASEIPGVCPACGQALPEEAVATAWAEAEAAFNEARAERLKAIQVTGRELQELYATRATDLEAARVEATEIAHALQEAEAALEAAATDPAPPPITEDSAYQAALAAQRAAEADLAAAQTDTQSRRQAADEAVAAAEARLRTLETALLQATQRTQGLKRIADLTAQEQTLAAEYERLEETLYLTDQFVRTKVGLLEARINARFRQARFVLFDTQINGGLVETCVTTFHGVPYPDLNAAAKIQIGLDIIRTLSEHYTLQVPIFVDQKESVTDLPPLDTQVIALEVAPEVPVLRVIEFPSKSHSALLKEA